MSMVSDAIVTGAPFAIAIDAASCRRAQKFPPLNSEYHVAVLAPVADPKSTASVFSATLEAPVFVIVHPAVPAAIVGAGVPRAVNSVRGPGSSRISAVDADGDDGGHLVLD